MATRFFFLPWKSHLSAGNGGAPRYAPGWSGYNWPGDQLLYDATWFRLYPASGALPSYAVTTDPDRVPLVESAVGFRVDVDEPFSHYNPSSISGTSCAYVDPGKPYGYSDSRNPASHGTYIRRPVANWIYQLRGTGALDRFAFLYRDADYQSYLQPYTAYTKVRLDGRDTYPHPMSGAPIPRVGGCRIGPALVYLYRPGVGILNAIMTVQGPGGWSPGNSFSPNIDSTIAVGATARNHSQLNQYNWQYDYGTYSWQDGDLLVWEMWLHATVFFNNDDLHSAYLAGSFITGGGLSGQPLTYDGGGLPNWAPAWYSKDPSNVVLGYEPEPLTWLTRAAPNGNGIELHFEDGSPEVTMTKARPSKGGIELTFGGAVQLATPVDLGTPASGITVLGVTSLSDTVKQVDLARTGPAIEQPTGIVGVAAGETQDFGEDVSTYPDLDPNFILQGGNRVVAETILRMLETPRGSLVYAPDRGYDVRALFGEAITQRTLAQAKRSIEAECLKDERVEAVATALDFDAATSTLQIRLEVTTAAGPFQLTLAVTAVSLTILDGGK